jgi:hypothetical protein
VHDKPGRRGRSAQIMVGHDQERHRGPADGRYVVIEAGNCRVGKQHEEHSADRDRHVEGSGYGPFGITAFLERRPVLPPDKHVKRNGKPLDRPVRPPFRCAHWNGTAERRPRARAATQTASMTATCATRATPTAEVESLTPRAVTQMAAMVSARLIGPQGTFTEV